MRKCPVQCPEETDRELKNTLDRMRTRICELEKKVVTFDTAMVEKEELREQMNDVGNWVDQVTTKHKEMFAQLSANYDALYAKHQETNAIEAKLRCEKEKLKNDNDRVTEQMRSSKRNEQHLSAEIDKMERDTKRVKIQLCETQTEVNDLNNEITKIQCSINGKEESICAFRKQLDENRREYDRLRDAARRLECDLKRANEELASAKACSVRTEQKLTLERDTLSNELECKRRNQCDLQTTLDEQKCALRDQKSSICKLEAMVADLTAANERDRRDTVARVRELTEENCGIREETVRKTREIDELRRKNDCQASEMDEKKRQLSTLSCSVDEMRCAVEKIKQSMRSKVRRLESNTQALECKMKSRCAKIAELDRETCDLRNQVEQQSYDVCHVQKITPVDRCPCPAEPCDDVHAILEKYSSNNNNNNNNECDDGSDDTEQMVCEIQGLNKQLSALKDAVVCGQK
ncbi:early endosome antigen 1-like [Adelges cooleyi]|uniref:early endosome antigen 1-like n=1 Tax=Adelges cooleyi TaxID=133065 RepID=UPI00218017F0|nr:early endosome antigen 1-like [Adelges cooleyi]